MDARIFVGRMFRTGLDGKDIGDGRHVAVLLSGEGREPCITLITAACLDALLANIKTDGSMAASGAPFTFDPPEGLWPDGLTGRQRYEALPWDEFNRAQTVLKGR